MRITLGMTTDNTLVNLNNQQQQINTLSQDIASGKDLQAPADNPYSWSQVMNTTQSVREYNSLIGNVNFATNWGKTTESSLSQLSTLLTQAQSVGETAISAAGQQNLPALANEVSGILTQAVSLANTQYAGQYIFAGTATDTAPYSIDTGTGQVTYSGNTSYIQVKTSTSNGSSGGMTSVNQTGDDAFGSAGGGSNVLQQIWSLYSALKNGDSTGISTANANLGNAFNQVNDQLSMVGTTLSGLTTQQSALNTMVTNEQGVMSSLQDTDVASATVKLTQAQTAFQAALSVTSILDKLNLASILS
ncbi:MAG: flagellin [Syntrophobacteraceae bacterium]|nr:flagellin [Syntrophobacteraceae bacterium]